MQEKPTHYETIEYTNLFLDKKSSSIEQDITNLIERVFPLSDVKKITLLKGGITNVMYLCFIQQGNGKDEKCVVRVNGDKSEVIIKRQKELEIVKRVMPILGGARLHCVFGNGLVYDFLEGRSLDVRELSKLSHAQGIARTVSRMHRDVHVEIDDMSVCADRVIQHFYRELQQVDFDNEEEVEVLSDIEQVMKDLPRLVQILKEGSVVFCHNDLLSGNIIYEESKDDYHLIDFEYAGYNYRGYDIGNHFAEYMGFECDEKRRPTKEKKIAFIKAYLEEFHKENDEKEVDRKEIDQLLRESEAGMVLAHAMWGLWATFLSKFSQIDFDYLSYAKRKIKLFQKDVKVLFSKSFEEEEGGEEEEEERISKESVISSN